MQSENLNILNTWPEEDKYYDFNDCSVEPSLYIIVNNESWKSTHAEEEASDADVLSWAEKSGSFDFLDNPEEDIYDLSDGSPA
jgi:hypothetical protein